MGLVDEIKSIAAWCTREELDLLQVHLAELGGSIVMRVPAASVPVPTKAARAEPSQAPKPSCPACGSAAVKGHGKYRGRRRYKCLSCPKSFNDHTRTPMAGRHHPEKIEAFAMGMAFGGDSLRDCAEDLGIQLRTAFTWRHAILKGYSVAPNRTLKGIVEADDTFFRFSEKGDKTVSQRRKPRYRGGKANKPGLSDEQVSVIVGCDREPQQELIAGVSGRGKVSRTGIEKVLGKRIDPDATLCTDEDRSFRAFATAKKIKHVGLNASKGERVKGEYHIQHVNAEHRELKGWVAQFRGVSTKWLPSYAQWYGLMHETKRLEDRKAEFIRRSLTHRIEG